MPSGVTASFAKRIILLHVHLVMGIAALHPSLGCFEIDTRLIASVDDVFAADRRIMLR